MTAKNLKILAIFLATLVISAIAFSQTSVRDLLIVSAVNYPDASVAEAIANKYGLAIYVINGTQLLSQDEINEFLSRGIKNVYLIGGPAVISEDVEKQLSQYFNVKRVFGMTKYGTSVEAAKYFFGNSSLAIIVSDFEDYPAEKGKAKLVLVAGKLAAKYGVPLLINPEDNLSEEVENALIDLGVKRVILVGNFSQEVINRLNELGITIVKQIAKRNNEDEVNREIEQKARELNEKVPLIIICRRDFRDQLASVMLAGHVMIVNSANDVNVSYIVERNFSRIKVLGYPECANQIANLLVQQGLKVETVSGNYKEVMRKRVEEIFNTSKQIREKVKVEWKEVVKLAINRTKVKEDVENVKRDLRLLELGMGACLRNKLNLSEIRLETENISRNVDENIEGLRERIRELWERLDQIKMKIRSAIWECREEIREIKDEFMDREKLSQQKLIQKRMEKIGISEIAPGILDRTTPEVKKCAEDLTEAYHYAKDKVCAQKVTWMRCSYSDKFVVAIPNECVASYLKEKGWQETSRPSVQPERIRIEERVKEGVRYPNQ